MLGRGGDHQNSYSRLEYFLMLFPPEQLQLILQLTNNELAMARKNYTMAGEIVKFFGVMLLVTRFEFGSRASLWSHQQIYPCSIVWPDRDAMEVVR